MSRTLGAVNQDRCVRTLREIAEELGTTKQNVDLIIKGALAKIKASGQLDVYQDLLVRSQQNPWDR